MQLTDKQRRSAYGALAITASLSLVLTGCQDEDFGYSADAIKYAKSYQDFFGDLPSDKSWDLSSYNGSYDPTTTRATGVTPDGTLDEGVNGEWQKIDKWWQVPDKTYNWMLKALLEGKDNRYLGSNFVLQLPENDFVIIPIFQGKSSIMSELEVKINGYAMQKIWDRSENIQVLDPTRVVNGEIHEGWQNIGYYDGYTATSKEQMKAERNAAIAKAKEKYNTDSPSGAQVNEFLPMYPSYTDEAKSVRSKPIYFRAHTRIGTSDHGFMYLSLHNTMKAWTPWTNYEKYWDENDEWTTPGHRLTSINPQGHMLALNVPFDARPSLGDLPKFEGEVDGQNPSQMLLIACEDANGTGTDHDVNDVAFLIIGYPNVPTVVPTKEIIEKRYMCEDLGGTYDFDFNDIVVDCKQIQERRIVAKHADGSTADLNDYTHADDIVITDMEKVGCPFQTAKISRVCGTIPLQVRIGDFMFPKLVDPIGHANSYAGPGDGKYTTRTDLIHQKYKNFCNGQHANGCTCDHHADGSNGGIDVEHQYFTRATTDYPTDHEITEGWNPNEEQIIPCHSWDPKTNNIIIYADWGYLKTMFNAQSEGIYNAWKANHASHAFAEESADFVDFVEGRKFAITFPKDGEYPFIIATDPSVPWMKEDMTIPEAWVKGDLSDHTNADEIGNSFYMENYPAADGEGYIWSGDVTGIAYTTGLVIRPKTAEMAGIVESQEGGRGYSLLNIYVAQPAGEVGRIGLYNMNWEPYFDTDPDGYMALPLDTRVHPTYMGVEGLSCVQIYLTPEQWTDMHTNGFVIASRTNGLRIKKVTTSRPCIYDGTDIRRDGSYVLQDPGYTVNINLNEMMEQKTGDQYWGMVMSNQSERLGETAYALVPFQSSKFISGYPLELTARGAVGYKLKEWHGVAEDLKYNNPLEFASLTSDYAGHTFDIYPEFAKAVAPDLHLEDGTREATITLVKNGPAYSLPALSLNTEAETSLLQTYGLNEHIVSATSSIANGKHLLTFTPHNVGETTFIVYQKEGRNNEYGVSEELHITVKVIESLPTATVDLIATDLYEWNDGANNTHIVKKLGGNFNLTSTVTTKSGVWGDINAWGHAYADLDNAHTLIVELAEGEPVFGFNRANEWGATIEVKAGHDAYNLICNGPDGKKLVYINLDVIRRQSGYVHLNNIGAADSNVPTKITSIKVDNKLSSIAENWNHITSLKDQATLALSTADFHQWNGQGADAQISVMTPGNLVWNQNQGNGKPLCGQQDASPSVYAELTTANALVVNMTADSDELTFWFNRNSDWSEGINVTADNRDLCAVMAGNGATTKTYIVDLDAVRQKAGVQYLHLNGINLRGTKATINSVYVDSKGSARLAELLASTTPVDMVTANGWTVNTNPTGLVYGVSSDNTNPNQQYQDLSDYKYLKIAKYGSYAQPRIFVNYGGGNTGEILWGDGSDYVLKSHAGEITYYYVDLEKLRNDKGRSWLNAIKSNAAGVNIKVESISLGK